MMLKRALSQIKPTEGQREKIYGDILDKLSEEPPEKEKETRVVMKKRKIIMSAMACVLVLICGITVSAAANLGWVREVLGSDVYLIEENIDDYKVEIGNVKIENAEDLSCKFSVGDVISDGSTILINILVEDELGELQWDGKRAEPGNVDITEKSKLYGSMKTLTWTETGRTDNTISTAIILQFDNKLKKGDVLEFKLRNGSLRSNEFPTPEEAKKWKSNLATVNFEIQKDVNDMKKTVEINKTATFRNRPFPIYADFTTAYDEAKNTPLKINIDTMSLSPLSFEIKGTIPPRQYSASDCTSGYGNIWLIYKNGDKICLVPNYGVRDAKTGEATMTGDFSLSSLGVNTGVIDLNEIEAIEFDDFTVPFNTNEADE